jgi:hypothetical protein
LTSAKKKHHEYLSKQTSVDRLCRYFLFVAFARLTRAEPDLSLGVVDVVVGVAAEVGGGGEEDGGGGGGGVS